MPQPTRTFPRHLAPRLREALRDSPAVLIHGPRQSGKTTLAPAKGRDNTQMQQLQVKVQFEETGT